MDEIITLDYGSGGKKTSRLIEKYILGNFQNDALNQLGDGAVIGDLAFSTDSFVVNPLFFPGGDIGQLVPAGVEELTTLEGIGEKLAERIVQYREEHGPFEAIADITRVPGIGNGIYSRICTGITVE